MPGKLIYFIFLLSSLFQLQLHAQSLIAHYNFKDGKVNNLLDRNDRPLVHKNIRAIQGVSGDAIYFEDAGGIIFHGRVNEFLQAYQNFSISFWYRSDDLQHVRSLMGKREFCDGNQMFDIRVSDRILIELYESSRDGMHANVSATIPDYNWHHYVFVRNGSYSQLFVDGHLADEDRTAYPVFLSGLSEFAVNESPCKGRDGTQGLKGGLDELLLFASALNEREVEKIYTDIKKKLDQSSVKEKEQPISRGVDLRLQNIFGTYQNLGGNRAVLSLGPDSFELRIFDPLAYEDYELLTFSGSYKIEAGQLILEGEQILLFNNSDSASPDEILTYQGRQIVGELYDNIIIDLYAFDTRLKLKK